MPIFQEERWSYTDKRLAVRYVDTLEREGQDAFEQRMAYAWTCPPF